FYSPSTLLPLVHGLLLRRHRPRFSRRLPSRRGRWASISLHHGLENLLDLHRRGVRARDLSLQLPLRQRWISERPVERLDRENRESRPPGIGPTAQTDHVSPQRTPTRRPAGRRVEPLG